MLERFTDRLLSWAIVHFLMAAKVRQSLPLSSKNAGDKIIAVDGVSTINKSFKDVILVMLRESKNIFALMRFLENKYAVRTSDLASVGSSGRYDRQRLLVHRRQKIIDDKLEDIEAKENEASVGPEHNSDKESDDDSEGEFQPDSKDEE